LEFGSSRSVQRDEGLAQRLSNGDSAETGAAVIQQGEIMSQEFGQESSPLQWPQGWPRTRLQDREAKAAWKKTYTESLAGVVRELKRLGATACLITRNDRSSEDQGVAVYFSLKPIDNYGWQEALGFIGEVPTREQIERAYKERIARFTPTAPLPI
jgi:hypothetical protein